MVKKLLTTRYFANAFNSFVDRRIVENLGAMGDVWSVMLFPILSGFVGGACFYFIWIVQQENGESLNCFSNVVDDMVWLFSIALPIFVIRIFAKRHSAKRFAMFMALPAIIGACSYLNYCTSSCNFVSNILLLLEAFAVAVVLFYKSYSHYRAFQIVGSLALILFATCLFCDNLIISCMVYIFWILSTAHILFRDKLLDYLEKR